MDIRKKALDNIEKVIKEGPYKDSWESLSNIKVPKWYIEAKFGIFIHWGVYSVPAFGGEWYPRRMYESGSDFNEYHKKNYGSPKEFGYKDFVPLFKAEKFDEKQWVSLFKKSGAKYVMPVGEHCDGYAMYDSDLTEWSAKKKGPKKDILGLLKNELEKEGLVFTTSSHRVEHYWFMASMVNNESDLPEEMDIGHMYWPGVEEPFLMPKRDGADRPRLDQVSGFEIKKEFMDDWLVRTCEIVDKYKPKIMYFDWWIQVEPMKPYLKKFAAYYYNCAVKWKKEVAINYKNDAFMYKSAVRDFERGQLEMVSPDFWQTDTAIAKNSWGYRKGALYKTEKEIVQDLIDIVSKNGAMLLNIGPKADGTIPDEEVRILEEIGSWLSVNGEAIYGSSYYKIFKEGETNTKEGHKTDTNREPYKSNDFRFTYKNGVIYVFSMEWPSDGCVRIKSLAKDSSICNALIKNVKILGYDGELFVERTKDELIVEAEGLKSDMPVVIKINID